MTSNSFYFDLATLNKGAVPFEVLVCPFRLLPLSFLCFSSSNVFSDINIFKAINICNNMLLINILFWTEALDDISIFYTDGMFLMQVLQTFSREIVIRCPACRSRLKDIHEMSPIVWVWYRLRNSFCLWSHPSIVRTPRTEIGGLLFARMHHHRISLRALHGCSGLP